MISFKEAHFAKDIILVGVRWYIAYPLSYRHVEELMEERGVPVDHATIQRWVVKYSPQLKKRSVVFQKWRSVEIDGTLGLVSTASQSKEGPMTFVGARR